MDKTILDRILAAWFDSGRYLTGETDEYGDTRYVGLHGGRCSEVVINENRPNELTVYQYNRGGSYLGGDGFEFESGPRQQSDHEKNLRMIGMKGCRHDFTFHHERNAMECHTTIIMIK